MFDLAAAGDRVFIRVVGILFLALQLFAFVVLALAHPPGAVYTGALFSPVDYYAYVGQMLHASEGATRLVDYWTYRQMSTPPIYLAYTALGRLMPPLDPPLGGLLLMQGTRLLLSGVFVVQAWRFFGEVLPRRDIRRVATLLALFTSGLGVFTQVIPGASRGLSYDLASPQSSAFFNVQQAPHDALVLVLLLFVLTRLHRVVSRSDRRPRTLAPAALAVLAVSLLHPDKVLVLLLTSALYIALSWALAPARRAALRGAIPAVAAVLAPGVPYAAYAAWLSRVDPVVRLAATAGTPPPLNGPLDLFVGYGVPGLLALAGTWWLWRGRREAEGGPLLLWSFVVGGLVLLPFNPGYHAAVGVQVALAGLAARTLMKHVLPILWRRPLFRLADARRPLGYDRRRLRLLSLNLVLILSSPTVLALAFASPRAALAAGASELYLGPDDRAALAWVRANVDHRDVVLGTPVTGEFLVAYGGCHVVYGDPSFTPDYDAEGRSLGAFFEAPAMSASYLRQRDVRWLYFGPREAAVSGFSPATSAGLQPRFRSRSTVIYRVDPTRIGAGS